MIPSQLGLAHDRGTRDEYVDRGNGATVDLGGLGGDGRLTRVFHDGPAAPVLIGLIGLHELLGQEERGLGNETAHSVGNHLRGIEKNHVVIEKNHVVK